MDEQMCRVEQITIKGNRYYKVWDGYRTYLFTPSEFKNATDRADKLHREMWNL